MGKRVHKLTNIDVQNKMAICEHCGYIPIVLKSNKKVWCCRVSQSFYSGTKEKREIYRWREKLGTKNETIEKIKKDANGVCKICNRKVKKLVLDHDHKTLKFRGAICNTCNRVLGLFNDDPKLFVAASKYLKNAFVV